MSKARRGDADSTPVRQGAATPPSAFSQARVSGPLFLSHALLLGAQVVIQRYTMGLPCSISKPAKYVTAKVARPGSPGQAGLKNVEGKARRRRQYASTARSRNAAIGIFSGPRLRPAILLSHKKRQAPITGTCLERQPTA